MIILPNEFEHLDLKGKVVGLTSGCFDLLHFYHLHYLERCRAECDFLIVGVDSDQMVQQFKNKSPVIPEYNRAAIVAALRCVKACFIMRHLSQFELAVSVSQKVFKNLPELYGQPIIGADKLVKIPDVDEITSTTGLVAKIRGIPDDTALHLAAEEAYFREVVDTGLYENGNTPPDKQIWIKNKIDSWRGL